MEKVYISLGSNKGNSADNITRAIKKIKLYDINVAKVSKIYITEPWGKKDQNDFLNCVLKLETDMSPWKLLGIFKQIELELGKNIKERWGERTIDIDIVFYGNKIIYEKNLIIPHPRFHLRKFVLIPLCDISCEIMDPYSKKSIRELLNSVTDNSDIKLFTI